MPIDILNKFYEPTIDEMEQYMEGNSQKMWCDLTNHIEGAYKPKHEIAYSTCSGKPGWNLKYKKSGKALCTIYPEKDYFICLVVLGNKEREIFDTIRSDFNEYIRGLYDQARLFNGTKWLMINVTEENILEDLKKLIELKVKK